MRFLNECKKYGYNPTDSDALLRNEISRYNFLLKRFGKDESDKIKYYSETIKSIKAYIAWRRRHKDESDKLMKTYKAWRSSWGKGKDYGIGTEYAKIMDAKSKPAPKPKATKSPAKKPKTMSQVRKSTKKTHKTDKDKAVSTRFGYTACKGVYVYYLIKRKKGKKR